MNQHKSTFYPASDVSFAQFTKDRPKFTENPLITLTRAQKEGLRYEKKAHDYLKDLLLANKDQNFEIKISPWIIFRCGNDPRTRIRFCQPDAVLISNDKSKIILTEIKYQHTSDAWRQLRLLYEPVLKFMFPFSSIACVEICRWFDPHTPFPEQFYYNEHPLQAVSEKLGVHIFRPRVAITKRKSK